MFIFGLIAVVYLLWQRLDRLEAVHRQLRDEFDLLRSTQADVAPQGEPTDERREWLERTISLEPAIAEPIEDRVEEIPTASDPEPPATDEETRLDTPEYKDAEEDSHSSERGQFDFEEIFGRRLPIWAGGVALAVAGIFLVRFSIEAGLLTPGVRVAASFAFGAVLLAVAETAYRFEERLADPRVRQSLSGAGLATLYAAFYLAGTRYGLIGSGAAFLGLAAVTLGAIALAFRYGLSSALLGLVGGFAAPALVASEDANVPVLTLYLALIAAGLAWTGARIGKPWLGFLALAGGFGWGAVLLAADLAAQADLAALGILLIVLGVGIPLLAGRDPRWRWPRLIAAAIASIQMALLLNLAGHDPLTWGLYLLLGAAIAVLGWREPILREANGFAAALGLWLLALWHAPQADTYLPVMAAFALIFIGVPLALTMRERAREHDLWQLLAVAVGLAFVNRTQWEIWGDAAAMVRALPDLALAAPVALALRHEWRKRAEWQLELALLAGSALLLLLALWVIAPLWSAPVMVAPVAIALAWIAWRREEPQFGWLALGFALLGVAALLFGEGLFAEAERLFGLPSDTDTVRSTLRWLVTALPFAVLAKVFAEPNRQRGAEVIAAMLGYGALAQAVPPALMPAVLAIAVGVLAWRLPGRDGAIATAIGLLFAWAALPVAQWFEGGLQSLLRSPMLVGDIPRPALVVERLVPLLLALPATIHWHREAFIRERQALAAVAFGIALISLHILFKQVLSIDTIETFQRLGIVERTAWEALLLAVGAALLWRAQPLFAQRVGIALVALALAHFLIFTLLRHNPLWADQAVGPWPVTNWILPAFAVGFTAILLLRRRLESLDASVAIVAHAALMALILVFALTELRHAFSGTYPAAAPLSQTEDLLRSVLGIVLAIGFLLWGRARGQRDWRIGSLVLMLIAVGKVFLFDAAGLEGLQRIASFLALGVSLIGIGWLYSRQLSHPKGAADA